MFLTAEIIRDSGWQAFERLISRLLIHKGFKGVRVVGGSGDKGADIIAIAPNKKRWLIQAKYWRKPVPEQELLKTIEAGRSYRSEILVVVALKGIDEPARQFQVRAQTQGHKISIWTPDDIIKQAKSLNPAPTSGAPQGQYQESAIDSIQIMLEDATPRRGIVIMATGLGKTFTAADAIRRARLKRSVKTLVLAHTNQLILQLEKAFWLFLGPSVPTVVWNQNEKPSEELLASTEFIFASRDSVANFLEAGHELPRFDLVLIDECHHAHSKSMAYRGIIERLHAGQPNGPQLLGLTATPFVADPEATLEPIFGAPPIVTIDMIYGLRHGFLSQVDYRLFTDNINWDGLKDLQGRSLSPREINKVFFIQEWDDAIIDQIQAAWREIKNPKAIIFCSTIEHAVAMRDKINARNFCHAEAIYSGTCRGSSLTQFDRNLILSEFESGDINNIICAVDVFNEGIDVPDVNIVVFNRVTHSRRIFIQQLGRGLRVTPGKEKALVLDFAQDIRRYAAGIKMKDELAVPPRGSTVSIRNKVIFRNSSGEDKKAESFLRAWLNDVERIEAAGDDDVGVLKFPPAIEYSRG